MVEETPEFNYTYEKDEPIDVYRVVVKFVDEIQFQEGEDVINYIENGKYLLETFPGIEIRPLCTTLPPDRIEELVAEAKEYDPDYADEAPNFLNFFGVTYPPGTDAEKLAEMFSVSDAVEYAYVEGKVPPPPGVNPDDDPKFSRQDYLRPSPTGIDAAYAWQFNGGDGTNLHFIDIERGWLLNLGHEDLHHIPINHISGVDRDYQAHGTAVLGIVAAGDNTVGGVGIAPNAGQVSVVSQWRDDGSYNTYEAILDALDVLAAGDVLLLEAQAYANNLTYPIEWYPHIHAVIRLATAKGGVVIEPAGNSGIDLNVTPDKDGKLVWQPGHPQHHDSLAVVVGAAGRQANQWQPMCTNQGLRVNCFAWGEGVYTTSLDPNNVAIKNGYTSQFSCTSAASAIVAGTAVVVQSIVKAYPAVNNGQPFSPTRLRDLLGDKDKGTNSNDPINDQIGVMPDLQTILRGLPGLPPP